MNTDILFSVIIPVYNREHIIQSAIKSVIEQDYTNWELILVDDGSTDNTGAVCKEFSENDDRIHYFKRENSGVSSARNFGLKHATGIYIVFLDSDDSLMNNCLKTLNEYILNTNVDLDFVCYGSESSSTKIWKPVESISCVVSRNEIREKYLPTHINIYPQDKHFLLNYVWNKCYRYNFIVQNNILFDESRKLWEDGIFVVDCLDKAKNILLIPEILHLGCNDPTVDHLSGSFHDEQIMTYINDEISFMNKYKKEYDFTSNHYCHSNLETLNRLLLSAFRKNGMNSKLMIHSAMQSTIVKHWVSNIEPLTNFEKYVKDSIKNDNYRKLVLFLALHNIKNNIKNLKRNRK